MASVILLVFDGLGVGPMPDAKEYGDAASNTLANASKAAKTSLKVKHLARLGIGELVPEAGIKSGDVCGAWGRAAAASKGKDSMTGHWELCGIVESREFKTFPNGFPSSITTPVSDLFGADGVLANRAGSGPLLLEEFGERSYRSGQPIVYTSSDSVMQISTHIDSIEPDILYGHCEFARIMLPDDVARIVARPFGGAPGSFYRIAAKRRDYPVTPKHLGLLTRASEAGTSVWAFGKVGPLFPGFDFQQSIPPLTDENIIEEVASVLTNYEGGLVIANLGDADSRFAHRGDSVGWCAALSRFDDRLESILALMEDDDVLIISSDHGNDPTSKSSDHTREFVPVLAVTAAGWRAKKPQSCDIGTRKSLADVGATAAEILDLSWNGLPGESFASLIP